MVNKDVLQAEVIVLAIVALVAVVGLVATLVAPATNLVGKAKSVATRESTQQIPASLKTTADELYDTGTELKTFAEELGDPALAQEATTVQQTAKAVELYARDRAYGPATATSMRELAALVDEPHIRSILKKQGAIEALYKAEKASPNEVAELRKTIAAVNKYLNDRLVEQKNKIPACINMKPAPGKLAVCDKNPNCEPCRLQESYENTLKKLDEQQQKALRELERRYASFSDLLKTAYEEYGLSVADYKRTVAQKTPDVLGILDSLAAEANEEQLTEKEIISSGVARIEKAVFPFMAPKVVCEGPVTVSSTLPAPQT